MSRELIGQIVGHYKILEIAGKGGMGVVYKAQDSLLNRIVAVKFLPHEALPDQNQQARFLQEARAAAALNHPNICPIHSLEDHEGTRFIVMAFNDGQTLRQRLDAGPVGARAAVEIGVQIAEGLYAAHELGIVHRDIKPENIMIRKDGHVQIMDFGLARLRGAARLTRDGSTVGTMAYMSPEQVQGHDVDHRTDVYSLGVVLYEILTGQLPFQGEDDAAIMYQIVNVDAPRLMGGSRDVNPQLAGIVAECLVNEPEERIQSAKEISRQLRKILRDSISGRTLKTDLPEGPNRIQDSGVAVRSRTTRSSLRRLILQWGGIGLAVAVIAVFYFARIFNHNSELNPEATTRLLGTPFPEVGYPSLSSAGDWVVFPAADDNGKWDVYFMNTSGGDARKVTNEENFSIEGAEISPDGSQIAYCSVNIARTPMRQIRLVSTVGGPSTSVINDARVVKWRPDGKRLAYCFRPFEGSKSGKLEIWSVRPNGSDNRLEFIDTLTTISTFFSIAWSPDGNSIAYLRGFRENRIPDPPKEYQEVIIHDLTTGFERQLTFDRASIDEIWWGAHDQIFFSSDKGRTTNIWMNTSSGGRAVQITKGGISDTGMRLSADNRKMVYHQGFQVGNVWLAAMDGSRAQKITSDNLNIIQATLSPDGKRFAVMMGSEVPTTSYQILYLMDRNGGNRVQITSASVRSENPAWSPNGKYLAYDVFPTTTPKDSASTYYCDANNPLTPRFLCYGVWPLWLNDSTLIVSREHNTWIISLTGGEQQRYFQDSTYAFPILRGNSVAYFDFHGARLGMWVVPAKHEADPLTPWSKRLNSTVAGEEPIFSRDRRSVWVLDARKTLWSIAFPDLGRSKSPVALPAGGQTNWYQSLTSDGKEIVFVDRRPSARLVMIEELFK